MGYQNPVLNNPAQIKEVIWSGYRLYLRPNKIAIVTVGPHKLVLDRLVVMFRNLKEMYGSRGRGTNGFLLNTSKTIQVRPSTVLLNISCIIIGIIDII